MSEKPSTNDVLPSCPAFEALPEMVQKMLLAIFNNAVKVAQDAGMPEDEILQFVEDRIDEQAILQARAEEKAGEKPIPWKEVKKGLRV